MEHEHAKLSPSTAHRWMKCGGSLKLIASMGARGIQATTPAMAEGVATHEFIARKLLKKNYKRFRGSGQISNNSYKAAEKFIDIILDLKEDKDMFVEKTVHLTNEIWGTSDLILTDYKTLDIFDYKNGRKAVRVEDNPQLMIYAAAALVELDELGTVEKVNIHIIQPQGLHVPIWQTQRLTAKQITDWAQEALEEALVGIDIGKLNAGPHCEYCPAQAVCSEFPQYALQLAHRDFSVLDIPEILIMAPAIRNWLAKTEEAAVDELKAGRGVSGFKLVYGRTHRKWSTDDLKKFSTKLRGIKRNRWIRTVSAVRTPSELEKKEPKLYDKVKFLLSKSVGPLQIASVSDTRPEVEVKQ